MSGIDEVRDRLDIVEVVGDYVQLKRAGRSYKGLCPFHDEKTPSFIVFPDSGNWRCFGACAIGGDAFDFVMRIENLDFRGALEHLARRYGVVLETPSPAAAERKDRRERLFEATAAAAEFFHSQLMRTAAAEPARAYLRDRDFGIDTAQAFGLGWAPDAWSTLATELMDKGFSEADLLEAGLVKARDSGGVYDTFRGRVVFPIHDVRGRPIGFGARTLDPEGVPKYLNSPQSPIFDKSHVLYGLHRAARSVRSEDAAVVVEGYTDVVRAHMAGFENVVASLGTAITEHQLRLLKRYTHTMVLALDADAAGQAATLRGLEVAREAAAGGVVPVPTGRGLHYAQRVDVDLRVVSMPEGKDPDDVIREGPANWRKLVAAARPVMDYLFITLSAELDLTSPGGKTTAAERLLPVVAEISEPVARSAWLSRLAQMIQIDEQALGERLGELLRQQRRKPRRRPAESAGGGAQGSGTGQRPKRDSSQGRTPRIPSAPAKAASRKAGGGGKGQDGPASGPNQPSPGAGSTAAPEPGLDEDSTPFASPGSGEAPPDWATTELPMDSRAAVEALEEGEPLDLPPDWEARSASPEFGGAEVDEASASESGRAAGPGPAAGRSRRTPQPPAEGDPELEGDPYTSAPRPNADSLVAWLLGNLLVDPRRLLELNKLLLRDQQPPLGPQDFTDSFQRDLITAIGYAAGGSAPPDAPAEHHMDGMPAPQAAYAHELRERALNQRPLEEEEMAAELRSCSLRLRKRELSRALPGLRYLMAEADLDAQMEYAAKVVELTRLLGALTRLLSPMDDGKGGGRSIPA